MAKKKQQAVTPDTPLMSERGVPLYVEDDSWSAGKKQDPFWSPPEEPQGSTAKRLYDKVRKK